MSSRGILDGQWADQYKYMRSSASSFWLQHLHPRRLRARPIRTFSLIAACFFLLTLWSRSSSEPSINFWVKYPSYPPTRQRPEDTPMLLSGRHAMNKNETAPLGLGRSAPSFHLLIPVSHKSASLCRTVTSSMILNYPPPTLISYGKSTSDGSTEYSAMVDRIAGIYNYLAYSTQLNDDDLVLIVDSQDVFFQLPAEVLVQRFQDLLRETNEKLLRKYGTITLDLPFRKEGKQTLQKYSQRVLFAASKTCISSLSQDPGCVTVPQSSLPPDAYGWKTDTEGHLNRPRWLKPGAVMGQVGDLRLIYAEILHYVHQHRNSRGDYLAMTQMFGRQEYLRELERRNSASRLKEWLYRQIGISDASNLTGAIPPHLTAGARYEYGIGVDYESRLFFNMFNAKMDVEWLHYHNVSTTSAVQMKHGVPRERRLMLPEDLDPVKLGNPFVQPRFTKDDWPNPPWNATLDKLPNYRNHTWRDLPLMTNIHSASVPALLHLDGDKSVRDKWWSEMWYQPWARALLRKYMRTGSGFDASQSALMGGQEWWDMRGGKGGLWTDKGEWLNYGEVCGSYTRDVFDDDLGPFGQENGEDADEPVYNQFGNVIKGKEDLASTPW
ncbi:hypothetical protein ASPACDRAFT_21005 [Aspergillus aculeatus ATCC 16872]|uniref:Uncharacterized protein n=1 Tax=Aspergillus aculeatus (strain ATCC 16872 / CBS 172.66 / WB 5094) TaxID=690307 RepID=A0A1L9X961_ASPA1|nr:uncharacterized protein ASPACDRAFT_21005 [Aspergillus aculeatus ATCC 16872]OJK04973.1 hypothetical protein ASPACDRAFT_21005 [Aspergillus aculeatus ATCC 16872]